MPNDSIIVDTKQLDILTMELKGFEKQVGEAAYHALNRTIDHVITQVGRIVPKEYAIKAGDVKETFKGGIKRPSKNDLTTYAVSKGYSLTLAHFPHSPQVPPASGKKYKVKATIKRGDRRTINTEPKPFVAPTGAKSEDEDKMQYNIFRRTGTFKIMKKGRYAGKLREAIMPVFTSSIPQMITNEKVKKQIEKVSQEKLDERLEHEIIYRMTSINKKIKKG
ncbi:hypothetical protein [Biomaibacter acetigenes]|uniref:Uncharacterized protein n=1 Tax=Biomaibacter acetigenes TaxID=2316383 RepID=A0A3G2R4F8_9FIRM|nr:hypothetical protein [Biomaibacter acetigenes]AYO30251.1 hypothetical protein D2962_06140 [Biomaibacter acetigenes]